MITSEEEDKNYNCEYIIRNLKNEKEQVILANGELKYVKRVLAKNKYLCLEAQEALLKVPDKHIYINLAKHTAHEDIQLKLFNSSYESVRPTIVLNKFLTENLQKLFVEKYADLKKVNWPAINFLQTFSQREDLSDNVQFLLVDRGYAKYIKHKSQACINYINMKKVLEK